MRGCVAYLYWILVGGGVCELSLAYRGSGRVGLWVDWPREEDGAST